MAAPDVLDPLAVKRRNYQAALWRIMQKQKSTIKKTNPEVTKEKNWKPKDINELEVKVAKDMPQPQKPRPPGIWVHPQTKVFNMDDNVNCESEQLKAKNLKDLKAEVFEFKESISTSLSTFIEAVTDNFKTMSSNFEELNGKVDYGHDRFFEKIEDISCAETILFENLDILRTHIKDSHDLLNGKINAKVDRYEFDEDLNYMETKMKFHQDLLMQGKDPDEWECHPGKWKRFPESEDSESADEQSEASAFSYGKRRYMG